MDKLTYFNYSYTCTNKSNYSETCANNSKYSDTCTNTIFSRPFQELLHDILYFDIISNIKKHIHFHLFELEHLKKKHLIELEHLPEHLIGEFFGARTMS